MTSLRPIRHTRGRRILPPLATDCDRHLTHIGDLLVLGRPANDELCRVPIPHRHPDISLQAVSWGSPRVPDGRSGTISVGGCIPKRAARPRPAQPGSIIRAIDHVSGVHSRPGARRGLGWGGGEETTHHRSRRN